MYANKKIILISLLLMASFSCFAHGGHRKMAPLIPAFGKMAATENVICTANIASLNFGEYHNLAGQDLKTQVPVSISCAGASSTQVSYTVALTQGISGNYFTRTLQSATNPNQKLLYNLFVDPTLKTMWGDGNQGTAVLSGICLTNTTCTQTVYAYIPAGQRAANVGEYHDDIVATLNY
jgi:spore coat protein U-like protein